MSEIIFKFDYGETVWHRTNEDDDCPNPINVFKDGVVDAVMRQHGINYYYVNKKWIPEKDLMTPEEYAIAFNEQIVESTACINHKIEEIEDM
jgi:hypothetical protein